MKKSLMFLLIVTLPTLSQVTTGGGVTFSGGSTFNPVCGPPLYCSPQDKNVNVIAPIAPPAINANVTDPSTGVQIHRVTDQNVLVPFGYTNRVLTVTSSSEQNTWNADSTKFYIEDEGGVIYPFSFTASTSSPPGTTAILNGSASGGAAWALNGLFPLSTGSIFSYTTADYLYGNSLATAGLLQRYSFAGNSLTTIKDWRSTCSPVTVNASGHIGDPTVNQNDTRFSTYVGGASQDTDMYVAVYDTVQGCRWYNTNTGQAGGDFGYTGAITEKDVSGNVVSTDNYLMHNARMSKDGAWMRITATGGTTIYFWQVDSNPAVVIKCPLATPGFCGGHQVLGYSTFLNLAGNTDSLNILTRKVTTMNSTTDIGPGRPAVSFVANFDLDSHLSWNNVSSKETEPTCGASYRTDNPPPQTGAMTTQILTGDNSIFCFSNSGTNHWWVMAHTFTSSRFNTDAVHSCATLSRLGTTVTATCATHGLSSGNQAVIDSASDNSFDGLYTVTVSNANTFTYTTGVSGSASATGAEVSHYTGNSFSGLPRGNISQNGKYYIFSSDWLGQILDHTGAACTVSSAYCRVDVFLISLY